MKALEGIRVLELTHMVSGPYAGMLLADLGAESIKIEPPRRGEMTRGLLADDPKFSYKGIGAYFLTLNRNKKSVTLDLKSKKGLALFYEFVEKSDVVLNNFSVGALDRLKINYAYLSEINPRIITCSITGFGESGPRRNQVAYDIVAQAMGATMSLTGHPATPPTRFGVPIGDMAASMMGVIGILAALQARERTGSGQHVDIAMLDGQISLLIYMATMQMLSGQIPGRSGNAHFNHVPYDTYPCQDGYLILAVVTDAFWASLVELLELPDLDTAENKNRKGRLKNRELIDRRLADLFKTNSRSYRIEKLSAARIPCAPVHDIQQALTDPQVMSRDMVVELEDDQGGRVKVPGNPVKLSDTHQDAFTFPPLLGEHTEEYLADLLNRSEKEIALLRNKGVI